MQDNIQAQQGIVSKLSDDQLVKEVKTPSGSAPTYLVMAEMQKRDSIRNAMGGSAPKGTVRDQMLQGAEMRQPQMPMPQVDPVAIAGMMQARGMAPQGMPGMPQGMPPMPQGMPQGAPQMPQGAPPAAGVAGAAQMAGPQGFANGGAIPVVAPYGAPSNPGLHLIGVDQTGINSAPAYAPVAHEDTPLEALARLFGRTPSGPMEGRSMTSKGHPAAQPLASNSRPGLNIQPAFANGGSVPHYVDGTPSGIPALIGGTADKFGAMTPEEYLKNLTAASSFLNRDNAKPGDLGSYSSNVMNQFGGPEAFTKPFNAPIDAARSQLSGMMDPRSQALIQAGVAMMGAPNGSLLAGLGVGLGAGMTGYQKAQLEQRGLQDRMADLQLRQSQAGLQGRMQSMDIGSRERQGDFSQYNTGRTLAEQQATNMLNAGQTNATNARQSADAALGRQTTMAAARLAQAGEDSRLKQTQSNAIPKTVTDLYENTYSNVMKNAQEQIMKMYPQVAGGNGVDDATQAKIDTLLAQAHVQANGVAKTVSGNYLNGALLQQGIAPRIPGPDGRMVVNPAYKAYLTSLGYAMPF
jgi:hypothetical protein